MASYITQSGERRTTVSVRLDDDELAMLDELARVLTERDRQEHSWSADEVRDVTRSEALREAIELALDRLT